MISKDLSSSWGNIDRIGKQGIGPEWQYGISIPQMEAFEYFLNYLKTLQQAAGNVLPDGSASRPSRVFYQFYFARMLIQEKL